MRSSPCPSTTCAASKSPQFSPVVVTSYLGSPIRSAIQYGPHEPDFTANEASLEPRHRGAHRRALLLDDRSDGWVASPLPYPRRFRVWAAAFIPGGPGGRTSGAGHHAG